MKPILVNLSKTLVALIKRFKFDLLVILTMAAAKIWLCFSLLFLSIYSLKAQYDDQEEISYGKQHIYTGTLRYQNRFKM